jgi:hypothetical protein
VECSEVLIVQPIRDRNPDFVPALVAHFVITEEQDRHPTWVKGVEDPQGMAAMLYSQFPEKTMTRSGDPGAVWIAKRRAKHL